MPARSSATPIQYRKRPPAGGHRSPPPPPRRPRRGGDWYAMRRRRRIGALIRGCMLLAAGAILAACAFFIMPLFGPDARAGDDEAPPADVVRAAAPAVTDDRPVVAIDPGHGGVDRGAEGLGFAESAMTWRTANELADLLEADGRFIPYLTITEQESQDPDSERIMPSERAKRAAGEGAELLLSIHGNSDTVYNASGYECYPIPPGHTGHDESLRFANQLAGAFSAQGMDLRGVDGVRYIYYDDNNDKVLVESTDTSFHNDPTFGVLQYAECPAVLSEQCFITNESDVAAFGDAEGCKAAAKLYYQVICDWFGIEAR